MYKTEMDRLSMKIDEEQIAQRSKKPLHDLVEEFFSVKYENISEKREEEIKYAFEIRCLDGKIGMVRFDSDEVQRIIEQIKTSLFTILDRSVDKTRKSWWENNTEDQSRGILVIRGVIRGIPYLGNAIDALIFGKS